MLDMNGLALLDCYFFATQHNILFGFAEVSTLVTFCSLISNHTLLLHSKALTLRGIVLFLIFPVLIFKR